MQVRYFFKGISLANAAFKIIATATSCNFHLAWMIC